MSKSRVGAPGSKPGRAGEEEEAAQRREHCSPEKGCSWGDRECTSQFVIAVQGTSYAFRRCFLVPAIARHPKD